MKVPFIALAAISLLATGCTHAEAETPAQQLRARLAQGVEKGTVLFGHHDDTAYGHTWQYEPGRSDVKEVTGFYPAIINWDLGGIENADSANLDGVPFTYMKEQALAQHERGGINTFSWHGRDALTNLDSWQTADKELVSRMVNTPEGQNAYNTQLDRLADFFLNLTDRDGKRLGVVFRPWHEHTGSWFWWGQDNCSREDYLKLWTMMRKRFDERGVDNILWAYSPDRCATVEKYLERYPGDKYVDIMGLDVYHFNGTEGIETYREAATTGLKIATEAAKGRGKLAAFTETGLESLPIADWYTSILQPVMDQFPIAYVTVWRNALDKPEHFYTPWPGHPAAPDFVIFSKNPRYKFVK